MALLIASADCISAPEPIIEAARYDRPPQPQYSSYSRRHEEEGKVLLQAKILVDGTPADIKVYKSSGFPELDSSAIESLRESSFIPAKTSSGKFVESYVIVPIQFKLED